MTLQTKSLADLLPVQEHYYLLHDGKTFAKHGTPEANGLLVFETREGADLFCQTVGKALPAFQPVRVDAKEFMRLFEEIGAVCIADGLRVVVATQGPTEQEPVNPEGVVPEDSDWEPAPPESEGLEPMPVGGGVLDCHSDINGPDAMLVAQHVPEAKWVIGYLHCNSNEPFSFMGTRDAPAIFTEQEALEEAARLNAEHLNCLQEEAFNGIGEQIWAYAALLMSDWLPQTLSESSEPTFESNSQKDEK